MTYNFDYMAREVPPPRPDNFGILRLIPMFFLVVFAVAMVGLFFWVKNKFI